MASRNASDVLVETIHAWGVDTIFGIPGDGINGVIEALRKRQDAIRFIHVRHEEAAAFMACGYAKFTGKIGCCLATSGPGGVHLLNGLYDAKMDGQPVLAITGMQFHDLIGTSTQQDVELDKLFMDVCVYNQRVMGAAHMENVAELACRLALTKQGVSHITIPVDIQDEPVKGDERSKRNKPHHVSNVYARSARLPADPDLRAAADVLNEGKKIVILAGRGALDAGHQLEEVAARLGAPIIKALLGKACVPDHSPYTTGGLGLLGTAPSEDAINECDTLFIIGSAFPYIEFYPKPGQAKCVQIDIDPGKIALRYPVEVGLVGDCKQTLEYLLPLLKKKDTSFLEKAQKAMRSWNELMETRGTSPDMPMKPQVPAWELGKRLRGNAIVCSDSGTNTTWWARQIPAKQGQMHTCSGTLATMACGLPYAIAAQVAYPDREVVAFVGDGGFSMLMAELSTAVKYKLPIKVFIIKNNTLGQIKWEQMVFLGNPEYVCEFDPIDFAMFARACGATGFTIDNPKDAGSVIDQALTTVGPVVVECVVDPNMPPLPAKIKPSQAAHFAEALARGTPERGDIIKSIVGEKVRELV
ncbi:MAG TPA: thiamine pyrophosphate-dependent enzyme [Bryobacteraceae bacterium]|jgi:pyruvate dehydrogenase (quinone)/pyruvate oxidase|nr:thiamine pyrophosphate-dependent enzyme [Bryobacteraceae bacterium]